MNQICCYLFFKRSAAFIEIATVGKGIDKKYTSLFQQGNSEVGRDNSNLVRNLTKDTDNASRSDGLSSDRVVSKTHSSTNPSSGTYFNVIEWKTVDEPIKTMDVWSNPTSMTGYGLKFEFENKTASFIEQVIELHLFKNISNKQGLCLLTTGPLFNIQFCRDSNMCVTFSSA